MADLITRQAAIDALKEAFNPSITNFVKAKIAIDNLPSAQPERLTDDDFETIRIHLNAYKEKLCNQHRWKEANEYQRIIDRFMAFASAQPEIIRCNECKYAHITYGGEVKYCDIWFPDESHYMDTDNYCSFAERRIDG